MAALGHSFDQFRLAGCKSQSLNLAPRGHHLPHGALTEVEDIADNLLLFVLNQSALGVLSDDQLQFLGGHEAVVARRRRDAEEAQQQIADTIYMRTGGPNRLPVKRII